MNASTIGVMDVPADDIGSYGIVETRSRPATALATDHAHRREAEGRAPRRRRSPSSAATCCRRAIFHHLRTMPPGAGGEIQLTDGIARLLAEEARVCLSRSTGRRYDCGTQARLSRGDGGLRPQASGDRRRFRALSGAAQPLGRSRHDADRAALHRRGRAGAQLRPRRAEVLREPARAVGGDPEARGGTGHARCSSAARTK